MPVQLTHEQEIESIPTWDEAEPIPTWDEAEPLPLRGRQKLEAAAGAAPALNLSVGKLGPPWETGKIGLGEWLETAKPVELVPFVGTASKAYDAGKLWLVAKRYQTPSQEPGDEEMLADFYQQSKRDKTWPAKIAEIVWGIPGFAGELLLTAGVGKASYEVGKRGALNLAEKFILNAAEKSFLARSAARVAGGVAQTAIQAPIARAPAMLAEIYQRNMPKVVFATDTNGKLFGQTIDRGEPLASAIPESYVNQAIETGTELAGLAIGQVGKKLLSKVPYANKVAAFQNMATAWLAKNQNKTFRDFMEKAAAKGQYHGWLAEIGEELLADVLRPVLVPREQYQVPTLEYLGTMGVAFAIPGVTKHGLAWTAKELLPEPAKVGVRRGAVQPPPGPQPEQPFVVNQETGTTVFPAVSSPLAEKGVSDAERTRTEVTAPGPTPQELEQREAERLRLRNAEEDRLAAQRREEDARRQAEQDLLASWTGVGRPAEAGKAGETIKTQPGVSVAPTLEQDIARYQQLEQEMASFGRDYANPEYQKLFAEFEAIRNRHGGMPPKRAVAQPAKPVERDWWTEAGEVQPLPDQWSEPHGIDYARDVFVVTVKQADGSNVIVGKFRTRKESQDFRNSLKVREAQRGAIPPPATSPETPSPAVEPVAKPPIAAIVTVPGRYTPDQSANSVIQWLLRERTTSGQTRAGGEAQMARLRSLSPESLQTVRDWIAEHGNPYEQRFVDANAAAVQRERAHAPATLAKPPTVGVRRGARAEEPVAEKSREQLMRDEVERAVPAPPPLVGVRRGAVTPLEENLKLAARLRALADGMDVPIADKRRPQTQNPTPKRNAQYRSRLHDADNLERDQQALRVLADAYENGTVPAILSDVRSKADVHSLVYKGLQHGGYYDVIPAREYSNTSPKAKALQELLEAKSETEQERNIREERERKQTISALEEKMRFSDAPGFFPTPKPLADEIVRRANIKPNQTVLEPSAGIGSLADAAHEAEPSAKITTVERLNTAREILEAKGYPVAGDDFLQHTGQYDRIVMNPPFEKGQDIDHVRHAYAQLKPGGKVVALMSESSFFRNDTKAKGFREWLESVGGTSEKSAEGAFKGVQAFRQTGTVSRIVEITKPVAVTLTLDAPESVEEQKARLAREEEAGARRAAEEVAAETMRTKAVTGIGGDLGSAGQGSLFTEPGQQEMFRPPVSGEKSAESKAAGPVFPSDLARRLLSLPSEQRTSGYGPANVELRRDVLQALTGIRPPASKAGAKAVQLALARHFGAVPEKLSGIEMEEIILGKLAEATEPTNLRESTGVPFLLVNVTKEDAQEIIHKLTTLEENRDLIEEYGLTEEQATTLTGSVPVNGGEWNVPSWGIDAVRSEMDDHASVLRNIAADAYSGGETGQSLRINKQAKRFETMFGTSDLRESAMVQQGGLADLPVEMSRTVPGQATIPEINAALEAVSVAAGGHTPIRSGRFYAKVRSIYKDPSEVIRLRSIDDLPAAAHEMAHDLSRQVFGSVRAPGTASGHPAVLAEWVGLGKALYGTKKPVAGYAGEGWAEFLRLWLSTDAAAVQAPQATRWFERVFLPAHPAIASALTRAQSLITINRLMGAAARAQAQLVREPGAFRRIAAALGKFVSYQSQVESFAPIEAMVQAAERKLGASLPPSANPFLLASWKRGSAGATVERMATIHMLDLWGNPVGPSLVEALAPVKGRRKEFMLYLFARRAIERWTKTKTIRNAEGETRVVPDPKNPGISLADARHIRDLYESPEFNVAAQAYYDWWDGVLNYVVQADPSMADVVQAIKQGSYDYAPLARMIDAAKAKRAAAAAGSNPLFHMRGSGLPVKDIFDQTFIAAARLVNRANRALVTNAIVKLAEVEGMGHVIESIPRGRVRNLVSLDQVRAQLEDIGLDTSGVPTDKLLEYWTPADLPKGSAPIIAVGRPGARRWFQVAPELYETLEGLQTYSLKQAVPGLPHLGTVLDLMLGAPARAFRLGTTGLRPAFALVTNPVRDLQTLLVQSSVNPAKVAAAYPAALAGVVREGLGGKSGPYVEAFYDLGAHIGQPLGIDLSHTRRVSNQLFHGRVLRWVKNPVDHLRQLLSITEAAPRVAELSALAQQIGWTPGTLISPDQAVALALAAKRVTIDFSAMGDVSRVLNTVVPFYNPSIQGVRAFGRTFRDHPIRSVLLGAALFAAPTLLNWWKNKDKEWYRAMPWRERYLKTWIDDGKNLWGVARPFEWGMAFMAVPEAMFDAWYRQDPEGLMKVLSATFATVNPVDYPVLLKAAKEQWQNRIDYWDRPIIPKSLEGLPPFAQRLPYTSRLATIISRVLPAVSPLRADAFIRAVAGGAGPDALSLIGLGAPKSGRDWEPSDIPAFGVLFRRGAHFTAQNQHIADLYDLYRPAQAEVRAWQSARRQAQITGQTAEAREPSARVRLTAQIGEATAEQIRVLMLLAGATRQTAQRASFYREAGRLAERAVKAMKSTPLPDAQGP